MPVVKEHPSKDKDVRVFSFTVPCAGPRPVTGHYTMPSGPGKYPAQISFHGYGAAFVEKVPSSGPKGKIAMFINAHGYELGREPEYYTEFYDSIKSNGKTFGLDFMWQNKSVNTAYFGWMCYRIMRAIQFLKSLPSVRRSDSVQQYSRAQENQLGAGIYARLCSAGEASGVFRYRKRLDRMTFRHSSPPRAEMMRFMV